MAKYDRRMLIPYLRDLYCTEILLMQKQEQRYSIQENKRKLTNRLGNGEIMDAPKEQSADSLLILCFLSAVICAVVVLCAVFFGNGTGLFLKLLLICVLLGLLCVLLLIRNRKNQKKQQEYQKWLKKHQEEQNRIHQKLEYFDRQLEELAEMCNVLHGIRHSLYSVNVIPAHYRTVQAVQYLLEYFKTSKANNPDIVLQTFIIEELRKPHLEIDKRMAEITMHQRILLANQIVADEAQSEYAFAQLRTIAEQEKNPDLRMQYQKIILENWNLSDYILKYERH